MDNPSHEKIYDTIALIFQIKPLYNLSHLKKEPGYNESYQFFQIPTIKLSHIKKI